MLHSLMTAIVTVGNGDYDQLVWGCMINEY